jgi:hypothetical protein
MYYAIHLTKRVPLRAHQLLESTRLKERAPVSDDFDEGSCASLKSIPFEKRAPVNDDSNDASSAPPESIERVHVGSISGVPTSNRVLVILTADD